MRRVHRFAYQHSRLAIAIVIGIIVGIMLPSNWGLLTRALTAWNVGVWLYLVLTGWLVLRADPPKVRASAEQEDRSALAVLVILSIAAIISVAAIALELTASKSMPFNNRLGHYVFTGATVLGSWLLVGVVFTFHYAHMFYRADSDARPLAFPDQEKNPDYWDFLYFSFTIAVAVQTSDVAVMKRSMRKVVLAHSVLSFFFNVTILGLSINIAASLIGT